MYFECKGVLVVLKNYIKFRLISNKSNDSKDFLGLKNKISKKYLRNNVGSNSLLMKILKVVNVKVISLLIILFPVIVYAGVFSIWNSAKNIITGLNTKNSQNINLLQGNISPSTGPVGGGDIAIVNNSALLGENSGLSQDGDSEHSSDQISLYVVRDGDSLSGIAKMFNVSVNTIIWTNDIKNNKVKPGTQLVILPISGVKHTVKSGDTLESIARIYKADINEVKSYNDIKSNSDLSIGDTIIIPDGEITTTHSLTPNKAGSKGTSKIIKTYSNGPVYDGYYIRPIIGGIKTQGIHGYNGVDLASSFGSDILASAEGDVIVAKSSGWNGGYGSYIVIKHSNGTQTLYAHLSGVKVSVGDHVLQGQVIGNMGSTGKSTGTHLHFEVRGAKNPF
jgi:LysM repeat protein